MKRSEVVLLTLMVGTVAALNLERQPNTVRNIYNSREDCLQDYSDEAKCREDTRRSGGGDSGSSSRWVGPDYRDDDTTRKNRTASGQETVKRGGFGFSGRGSSS